MKTKKRCDKIEFCIPSYLQKNLKTNSAGLKYINDILAASEGIEQINILKDAESYLLQNDISEDEMQFVTDILSIMFYQAPVKSSHKKALSRTIQGISKKTPSVIEVCLLHTVKFITNLSPVNVQKEVDQSVIHLIYMLDNLFLGKKIINESCEEVWKYITVCLKTVVELLKEENSHQKMNDYYNVCQNILKLLTLLIQNCDKFRNQLKLRSNLVFQASSDDMIICLDYLLTNEKTKMNCRLNAAFAYCNYFYISFGKEKLKDMLSESSTEFPLVSKLCIHSSIMAVLSAEDFIRPVGDFTIADEIVQQILQISNNSDSSEILLLCGRNLLQWTNVIQSVLSKDSLVDKSLTFNISHKFCKDKVFMKRLFEYVLHCREHFIDSLRHLSKDIFRNILNLHLFSSEPNDSILLKEMTLYLLKDLPIHNRGKYGMLSCIVEKIGTETILEWNSSLPSELYKALEEYSLVSHVSELLQVLFSCMVVAEEDEKFQNIWLIPLLELLCKGSKEQTSAITEQILPKLLSVKPSSLTFLLSKLFIMWENNIGNSFSALIICMKLHQKQNGFLSYREFMPNESLMKAFFHGDDQEQIYNLFQAKFYADHFCLNKVRLSAFSLLCDYFKTTEPIDSNTLELIKCGLPYSINCQSPPFRQQLISYMKKLFCRMVESGYALMKKQNCSYKENKAVLTESLPTVYQEFLRWLKKYLFSCLYPGANFPRRVTSLNLLYILHETFQQSFPIVDCAAAVQTLIYALQDTYDNNRLLALKLLSSEHSYTLDKKDETLFKSALTLASSTKPPETATAAYLFTYIAQCPKSFQLILKRHLSLLASSDSTLTLIIPDITEPDYDFHLSTTVLLMFELNKQLHLAKKSLLEAAASTPLYGILTCIRSILNDVRAFHEQSQCHWQHLLNELIALCLKVAYVVEPIVCNSSPEGHLPMDTNEESIAQLQAAVRRAIGSRFQSAVVLEESSSENDSFALDIVKTHAVTAQILLLCCWRTHKEVSLLFGDISEKVPLLNSNSSSGVLSVNLVEDIGKYFLHQMSLVKHKGAFEQAHIGFSKLCHRLWRSDIDNLHKLPEIWLKDMILAMKGLKEDIQLCPTRRSAGLPFIIQAIMASEPSFSNSVFFKASVSTFLSLAQSSVTYSPDVQVHALNVLRTLFRDACLGEAVMPFLSEGFKIAVEGFKSSFWAARNSSTLLFSALMTRMFGVNRSHDEKGKKNRLTGKSFYSCYKDLYVYLIDEIKLCVNSLLEDKENKISIQPSLYPVLLLLGRLYPAPGEEDIVLSVFIPYLQVCSSNPIWKTRTLSAKALVTFTPYEKVLSNLEYLFKNLNVAKTFSQNELHGKLLQILYLMEEVGCMPEIEKNSLKMILESNFSNNFDFCLRYNKCASTKAAFLQIYLCAMTLGLEPDGLALTEWLLSEFETSNTDPDIDNFVAIAVAIVFLKELQLPSRDFTKKKLDTHTNFTSTNIFLNFLKSHFYVVKYVIVEIFLWLLQSDSEEYQYNPDSSDDVVVVQKVLKTVALMDKRKYNVKFVVDDDYVISLIEMLDAETDPSLLRQIYKLLSFLSSSLSLPWKFLKPSECDMIKKLEFILNSVEKYSRDDITCELLIYSAHLVAKLFEKYQSFNEMEQSASYLIKEWLKKTEECANPDNSILLRKTVVSVLKILGDQSLFNKLNALESFHLWQALLLVLVDDEPDIKYRASEIVMKIKNTESQGNNVISAVPSKAVDMMIESFTDVNGNNEIFCTSTLVHWMLSSNSATLESMTDEQPFDKGELNVFSEELNLTEIASNHLSSYLKSQKSSNGHLVSTSIVLCWNDKNNKTLTFPEVICRCLSEANSIIEAFLTRSAVSPILDAYFDQELIHVHQRLAVVLVLLPFSDVEPDFSVLSTQLLQKFTSLDFRTVFIEDIIVKILGVVDYLSSS